jgi:aryl-alcohol dehydrogenase-like predicted oxidoreductase
LNAGVLTGKYLDGAQPAGARFTVTERNRARYDPPGAEPAVRRYLEIAKDHKLDPAQMALAFTLSRDFVAATIIGATNLEQLTTDVDAANLTLSAQVLDDIQRAYTDFPDVTA